MEASGQGIMRKLVLISIVLLSVASISDAQSAKPKTSELSKLGDEYVKSTQEYKASLQKLLALYEDAVKKAEQKRDAAQKLYADGLMDKHEVEQAEIAITSAQLKVTEVQQQIKTADAQIAQALAEIENPKSDVAKQYKRAIARQPKCRHWTLTSSAAPNSTEHGQHRSGENPGGGGVFKVVCQR